MKPFWRAQASHLGLLMLCIIVLSASGVGSDYPMNITDSAGREVTLKMPVERIIVTSTDAAEAVINLGAEDRVVAVSNTVKSKKFYFPSLKDKPSVGTFNSLDYEMMGAIARGDGDQVVPDIIVIGYTYPGKSYGIDAVARGLAPFKNIACIGLDFYQPENMTAEMEKLGVILNKEAKARDYIDWYNEKNSDIMKAVGKTTMPKVYVEWTSKGTDLTVMGPASGAGGMLRSASCFNIASKLTDPYPVINWEWVVSQKPDIIIKRQTTPSDQSSIGWEARPSQDTVALDRAVDEILSRSAATAVPAVKNDKVYIFSWDFMAGPDQVVGLTYLAKVIHPEADLDPESVYKEYLQKIGLTYPEGRIFVYPDLSNN